MYHPHEKIYFFVLLVLMIVFSVSFTAKAQTDTQKTGEITETLEIKDDQITATIEIQPNNVAINAVGVYLNFSTTTLKAIKINSTDSFCELFIEQIIDNKNGQIRLLCGLPTPGIKEKSIATKIEFTKINPGWTNLSFDKNTVLLANDGLGTDVLGKTTTKNLFIK